MNFFDTKYTPRFPWTNVYGLARSLFALSTLSTLLFNNVDILFRPTGISKAAAAGDSWLFKASFFSLLGGDNLILAKWIAILALFIVILGLYPRITGLIHWYITASFFTSSVIIDGGDQAAAVFTLLLIPVALTDPRKSHWDCYQSKKDYTSNAITKKILCLIALSTIWVIRLQVCVIYLWAGVEKLGVTQWVNGTVLYYWFLHPSLGLPLWQQYVFMPLIENSLISLIITWSIPVFEIFIAMCLLIKREYWKPLLFVSICFHLMIVFLFGLVSFFFSMTGCLVLYFIPYDHDLNIELNIQPFKQKLKVIPFSFK